MLSRGPNCLTVRQFLARQRGGRYRKGGIRAAARALELTRHRLGPHHRGLYKGCFGEHTYCPHSTRGTMAPFKPKPRQPPMTKAELRAQGIQALAQVTTPIIKLPMKIRRQCRRSSVRPAVTQRGETRDTCTAPGGSLLAASLAAWAHSRRAREGLPDGQRRTNSDFHPHRPSRCVHFAGHRFGNKLANRT